MAKCDVEIYFDEPDRTYLPGDTVRGFVRVNVDSECKCKALTVALEHSTHGKGNHTSQNLDELTLFEGKWVGQGRHEYPFELRVPFDARPYNGTLLNVAYNVHARADIPWAIDPKASITLNMGYPEEGVDYSWDDEKVKKETGVGCLIIPALFTVVGAFMLAYGTMRDDDVLPMGLGLFAFGFLALLLFGRNWAAAKRLGSVSMNLQRGTAGGYRVAEDKEALFVVVKTGSTRSVTGIVADLKIFEQVVRGSGSNRRTYTHSLFASSVTLEQDSQGEFRGRVTLPADGECPPSIKLRDNRLVWQITTRVDIPLWPDWVRHVELQVAPKPPTSQPG